MTDFERPGHEMLQRALATDRQEFGSFFLSRLLGFAITYGEATCTVAFEAVPPLFNPQGSLHGGVLATALDISMGHLLHHTQGAGATLEMKIQYLAPITAGEVRCEASFLRRGRSVSFLQSRVLRADGALAAHATATWKQLSPAGS
jgi:uncharacterized protein (TIGR00369 family)